MAVGTGEGKKGSSMVGDGELAKRGNMGVEEGELGGGRGGTSGERKSEERSRGAGCKEGGTGGERKPVERSRGARWWERGNRWGKEIEGEKQRSLASGEQELAIQWWRHAGEGGGTCGEGYLEKKLLAMAMNVVTNSGRLLMPLLIAVGNKCRR